MAYEFRVPDVGEGIAEVEIVDWLVQVGDHVEEDQMALTVQTDKSLVEIPTPVAGKVISLAANQGDTVPVGSVLFSLEPDNLALAPTAPTSRDPELAHLDVTEPPGGVASMVAAPHDSPLPRVKAAPSVRRLADEYHVELAALTGTGPSGRVTRQDVLDAAAQQHAPAAVPGASRRPAAAAAPSADEQVIPLRGLRRQIARNMVESWRAIPHIIDWRQADASGLVIARNALRQAYPEQVQRLTYLPILVKIVAVGLRAHPLMNASLSAEQDAYIVHRQVHVGIATATPDGLIVPVVHDADQKSILELAAEIAELVTLARARRVSSEQLNGGTYTVNNLGAIGASMGTPIIRSPEVGIMGFGRITDTVTAEAGTAVVKPMLTLSSVGDHRLHDGDTLSAFTGHVVRLIEQPVQLLGALR